MTRDAKLMSGITLIIVRTISYGGYFLLTSLMNKSSGYDSAMLPIPLLWFVRIGVPFTAVLISAGFFFSVLSRTATHANGAVSLIYLGAVVRAVAVVSLGIGLLKAV